MKSINYWETVIVRVSLRVLVAAPNTEFVQAFLQNVRRLFGAVLPLAGCCKHLLSYFVSTSEGIPLLDMFLLIKAN
jgi:hypothetical protein